MNGFMLQSLTAVAPEDKITRSFMKAGLAGKTGEHMAGQDLSRSGRY